MALACLTALGAHGVPAKAEGEAAGLEERARALAAQLLIVDTHIDFPIRRLMQPDAVRPLASSGQFDYPRARLGGLDVAFMSIFTSPSAPAPKRHADALIDLMEQMAASMPERFGIATCAADVAALRASGRLALPLGMENGSPLGAGLVNLDHFMARGVRYVTLAHGRSNALSDSSYDVEARWRGLSPLGQRAVAELNAWGVMIDVSHLSDAAAWQVLERSAAPVIASHSSLRHFLPGFHRNMDDALVRAVAEGGGVVQINFGSGFVSNAARRWAERAAAAYMKEHGGARDREGQRAFQAAYRQAHPYPYATVDTVIDHIDRVVAIAGIEHVGIGSDYDGVGDTLPIGLKDVADFPNLIAGLLRRGYGERDLERILGANLMRVWCAAEDVAALQGRAPQCRHAG